MLRLVLAALGVKGIGHFGFLCRELQPSLWPRLLADLKSMAKQQGANRPAEWKQ